MKGSVPVPYKDPEKAKANKRQYYLKNRAHLLERQKLYKEAAKERSRQYYLQHRESILAKRRQQYAEHRHEERARQRQHRRQNYERIREREKQYEIRHQEHISERFKKYYEQHRDDFRTQARTYYHEHREEILLRQQQYKSKNKQRLLAQQKHYKQHYAERLSVQSRLYRQINKDKVRNWRLIRRARKYHAPRNDLSVAQWREIEAACDYRCVYCERQLQRLTQDHLTPLSKGGSHTVQNVLPACPRCNSKKNAGLPLCSVQPFLLTIAPPKKRRGA